MFVTSVNLWRKFAGFFLSQFICLSQRLSSQVEFGEMENVGFYLLREQRGGDTREKQGQQEGEKKHRKGKMMVEDWEKGG